MIERIEIDDFAKRLQVNPTDVQRDYVNGAMLAAIFARPNLAQQLVLKGGNALRKGYFQNTRYSRDLDFSTAGTMNRAEFVEELRIACSDVTDRTDVRFVDEDLEVRTKTRASKELSIVEVRAYFLDFYGKKQSVPVRVFMDVTEFDRLDLPAVTLPLIHPYSDAKSFNAHIRCAALEEILASKLKCLLQRRHAADLYDYVRWLFFSDVEVDRTLLLRTFLRKTIYHRSPGVALRLLLGLPVAALQELWDRYVVSPIDARLGFSDGFQRFIDHLHELFGPSERFVAPQLAFFDAATRASIMDAGRDQRLLRVQYGGRIRDVEPYSIVFRQRNDGGGGEYFYVWDRTGGSSPPGDKCLVPEKLKVLGICDEKFEPRYEIEVAKAGDIPETQHFPGRSGGSSGVVPGFGITRSSSRRRTVSSFKSKHVFRCPSCGRLHYRLKYDSKIKPHMVDGRRCPGGYGAYEGRR